MENEVLKDIENYEGLYMVSSFGRVYSLISKKFKKPFKNNNDYLQVELYKDNKVKKYLVHRLVAQAFIPNPLNYKEVNHKDENPSNNHVENLEFCDRIYNINYGTRTEKCSKSVLQFTKDGEFVKEYPSTIEAERQTKIPIGNISNCCLGKRHSAGGFVWKYKNEVV